ncbi:MAG: hypothetical protein J6Z34_06275 [Clostridia bacterium]|nr:hypothetical protein [Clostridia bacterium]
MRLFNVLLKKELLTQFLRGGRKKDYPGLVVTVLISLVFLALFVYLFVAFQAKFSSLNLVNEVLVIFAFLGIFAQIIFSVPKACAVLYGGADAKVILPLPISNVTMLTAKLIALWIKETVNSAFFVLPVFVAFGIMRSAGAVYYIFTAIGVALAALFAVSVSALLAPLFVKLKKFFLDRPYVILAASLVFLAALFAVYSQFLKVVSDMLIGNRLRFIFNKDVADKLRIAAKYAFFARQLADFTTGSFLGFAIVFFASAGLAVAAYFVTSKFYFAYLMANNSGKVKRAKEKPNVKRGVTGTLVNKELTEIFRNPTYLFSYLSVLLTLPLFCYLTVGVLNELIEKLLGGDFILPFAILITVLYSCVCNTGAGDVISREGSKIMIVKTIPVSYGKQIAVKVIIALVIACVSDILTVLVLFVSGTLGLGQSLIVFLIAFSATAASVMRLVAKDINRPAAASAGGENSNVSTAIVRSMLLSALLGAVCFFLHGVETFYTGSGNAFLKGTAKFVSAIGGMNGVAALALALCVIYAIISFGVMTVNVNDRMRRIKI